MTTSQSRTDQPPRDDASKRKLLRAETGLLALLLLRGKRAIGVALERGNNPAEPLAAALRQTLFAGRQSARAIGLAALSNQLGTELRRDLNGALVDAARASQVAQRTAQRVALAAASAPGATAAERWAEALKKLETSAATSAATETFSAATAERTAGARRASAALGIVLMREWDAEIDACPLCRDLDGAVVGLYEPFPGGLEPGHAHPRCRCFEHIVRVAEPQRAAGA